MYKKAGIFCFTTYGNHGMIKQLIKSAEPMLRLRKTPTVSLALGDIIKEDITI